MSPFANGELPVQVKLMPSQRLKVFGEFVIDEIVTLAGNGFTRL